MSDNSWLTSMDGLPPAGTECEVLNPHLDNAEWEKCKILFMGNFVCVYESESCRERVGNHDLYNLQFRPIKTERDLAIEAARHVLKLDEIPWASRFGQLYDAGLLRSKNES